MPPAATVNCSLIEGTQRDNTEDWIVPRAAVPTIAELEARIDEALVIARASEEGVREVGDIALDAARQARRAAEAAEASAAAVSFARSEAEARQDRSEVTVPSTTEAEPRQARRSRAPTPAPRRPGPSAEARLRSFNERADRLLARVRAV